MKLVALLSLLCASACASPTLTSDPFPAGANQPTSCSIDAGGRTIPCTLVPTTGGAVIVSADLASLPAPGVYPISVTVSIGGTPSCTGSGSTVTCTSGVRMVTSPAITLTLTTNPAPPAATLHIGWP